jgi:ankyrin repeat protein
VNLKSKIGETALTAAVMHGDEFAVKELIAAGADLNNKTKEGQTALIIARDLVVGRKPAHDRIYAFLRALTES